MTATRDRRSDPDEDAELAWDERPIIGKSRGLPWWGAVLLAFGLAAIAAYIDMQRQDSLGKIYQGAYIVGCIAAVCWVRRRSLFGPMVQPPLVFAVTAIGAVVLFASNSSGGGLRQLVFSVALPLTSNFPTMAITTGATAAVGLFRLWWQRNPNPEIRANRPAKGARGSRAGAAGVRLSDREHPGKDRVAPPPRTGRGRGEPDPEAGAAGRQGGRRMPGRGTRPPRDEPRPDRRDAPPRGERGRTEPPPDDRGRRGDRGRGRQAEPPPRRRDPGAEGRSRREPPRRGGSPREGAPREPRDGRGSPPGRQRRRPPDSYR